MGADNRESALHGADDASSSPLKSHSTNTQQSSPTRSCTSRSTSPAKRRASEMDADHTDKMELEVSQPNSGQNVVIPDSNVSSEVTPSSTGDSSRTGDSSLASTGAGSKESLPSIDEQVESVVTQIQSPLQTEKLAGYVVAHAWLNRVIARSKFNQEMGPFDKGFLEGEIGPVDNGSIVASASIDSAIKDEAGKSFVPLKKGLRMGQDVEVLPEAAWKDVVKWHGLVEGQRPIIRYLHEVTVPDSEMAPEWQYELYPPTFTLRKLVSDKASNGPDKLTLAPRILASTSQRYMEFLKVVKRQLNIPLSTKIKVARVVDLELPSDTLRVNNTNGMPSPPESRGNSPAPAHTTSKLIIDQTTFRTLQENDQIDILDRKDESMNEKYNGSANLNMLGLRVDQTLVISEESKAGTAVVKKQVAKGVGPKESDSAPSSGRASPAMMTRGRHRSQGRSKGTVGLTNLGNTCYMNSALQCMRACQELSTFFISNAWQKELNPDNPIGHKGQIAQSYANLLHEVYDKSPASLAPRAFKTTLGRFAPMFSGYGQQDSQEFMSFLVDGLHEDLNRVKKKPYRENPDSDDATVHDPEAIRQLGEVFRDNHRARNSSIITDLFNGFYKNKLVCPDCSKISITFDPFSLLTLQLPMEHYWEYTFEFYPLNNRPVLMRVNNTKGQTMKDLKEFVASKFPGLDVQRLLMYEHFSSRVYRVMEDRVSIAEANMLPADDMIIYELEDVPTNFPPKPKRSMLDVDSKPESDVPVEEERQLVTIYNRLKQYHYSGNRTLTLVPMFITLSREEASDYTEIYRKILRAVANMTTRDLNELVAEADDTENDTDTATDSDEKAPNSESTSESAFDKADVDDDVKTRSLASDSFVDISMEGTNEEPKAESSKYRTTTPAYPFLKKGAPIPAPLMELFEVYVNHGTEAVPFGSYTSSVEPGKLGIPLKSRIPKPTAPPTPEESIGSPSPTEASDESTQELEDPADQRGDAQMSYEPDEDGTVSAISFKPGSSRNNKSKRNKKQQKKYTKGQRGFQNSHQQPQKSARASQEPEDAADGEDRLIRPFEYIGIDWNDDFFEQLFGKPGGIARKQCELFADPELEQKLSQREQRRKKGVALEDCFEETAKEEILTEENAWYCGNCKERRQAAKKLEIWTSPDILVIHLKRFSSGRMFRDKVDMLVDFPVEGLDLTGRVGVDEGKPLIYDLFAVDNHYGGLGGGHYTAFARNFFDDEWYEYNDSHVSKCSAQSVVTKAAYLLFYRRRSEQPLGPAEVQNMVRRYFNDDSDSSASGSEASASSQSGNGGGPTGASLRPGSSSGSQRAPVAARPPRRGGAAGSGRAAGELDRDEDSGTEMGVVRYVGPYAATQYPPLYGEEDETLGLEESFATMHEGGVLNPVEPSWSWKNLNGSPASRGSVEPNVSEDELDGKMVEDFGDEMDGQSSFTIGPQLPRSSYNVEDVEPRGLQSILPQEMEVEADSVHRSVEGDDAHGNLLDTEMK